MKFLKKSIYALSMMSMLGLWACSSDELLPGTTIEGDPVSVKITVSRACDQTRTIISENKETGGLNNVWEEDDRLAFFNANGEKAGELVLTEGEGYSTAVFEGEVVGTTGDYQLWYFGKPADGDYSYIEFKGGTKKKKAVVDLSNQNFESPQELSARDIMSASVSINIDGKKATVAHNVTMQPQLAMARFTLAGIPEDADGTLTISDASSETMIYKAQCDLAEGSTGPVSGSAGTGITINNVNAVRDVFVALYPASYTLKFKFETTSGDIYSYAFTQPAEIEAGKYYTAFDKEEGAENGTFAGVQILLEKEVTQVATLTLHANFNGATPENIVIKKEFENGEATFDLTKSYLSYKDENNNTLPVREGYTFVGWGQGEDVTTPDGATTVYINSPNQEYYAIWIVNPLYKWAEGDLVYNKSKNQNTVASTYTTAGSLYQWGRNIGWSDYKDAMGSKSASGIWSYGTYNRSYATATGFANGYDDSCMKYTAADYLPSNKDKYFMNPDGTDYWISSFGDGGSNWNERANKCGWTENICPTGYRMPNKEDFLEIKPSSPISGSGSLASLLNITEIKDYKGNSNYKVVWRWSSSKIGSKHYLRIDARVVDKNFKQSDISTINWDDKASVVTRYFGAHGSIHGFKHINNVSGTNFPVARPMPGTEVHADVLWQSGIYWTVLWNYITDLSKNNEGYYWMADEKTAFTFQDNTAAKAQRKLDTNGNATGVLAFPDTPSIFGTLPINAQDCCAIRCIITNRE